MDKDSYYDEPIGCVVDSSIYSIGKDIDGNEKTTKELHELILSLILELDRVCRKNDIPYALGFGSALGCYNYHGFIPWDDDADIVIKYEDINRLVEACKKDLNSDFQLDCYENNKEYNVLIPTLKLRKKDSYIKEVSNITLPNRCGSNGLFIDIVAFMGVPEDKKEHYKLIKYSKRKMPWYVFLDGILRIRPNKLKAKLKKFELDVYNQYKDSNRVSQTVIIPWQDWSDEVDKLSFPRDVIFPFREYDFEGHKIYSFNDVKEFARLRYGDKSLRKWDGEKWVDPYPIERKKVGHIKKFSLNRREK